jgi:hypothetical protein
MTIPAERDGWSVIAIPSWHVTPPGGNVRTLGPTRRRRKRFVPGELYTKAAIAGHVWTDNEAVRRAWAELDESAPFRCGYAAGGAALPFTLLEQYDPRVPAGDARELMAKLTAAGLSAREVARRTGISPDTAARAAQGVGRVRHSTVVALDELAASLNGGRGRRRSRSKR